MSLNGKLEDVSLADVMQFIHLGRRTGTLSLTRGQHEAEIGFHRGQIVSAWSPGSKRLGDLLVAKSLLDDEQLKQLLRRQSAEQPRKSLGQLLVQASVLSFDQIRKAVEEQIESTIFQLVSWTAGSFEFALDELKPIDDIAMYPGDVLPKLDLNTQMLLLEATRVYDENRRDGIEPPSLVPPPPPETDERRDDAGPDPEREPGPLDGFDVDFDIEPDHEALLQAAHRRLQVVSPDRSLADSLREIIPSEIAQTVPIPLREAGTRLPGEPTPTIVALDMRKGAHSTEDLSHLRRSRPRSSVIALIDSAEMTTRAFEVGAVAAIPANPTAIAACFNSLVRTLQDSDPRSGRSATTRAGFARLRRVLADIRSGLLSATMALNLMHILSESVERAVLFLVRDDGLSALGAFGFGASGSPLAEATRGLKLPISGDNVLTRCLGDGQPRAVTFEQALLPEKLGELIGRPKNGQVVVFPVMGSERVISVVYTDNGPNAMAIEDIELLELATAQVGVAFENELLRRQIGHR